MDKMHFFSLRIYDLNYTCWVLNPSDSLSFSVMMSTHCCLEDTSSVSILTKCCHCPLENEIHQYRYSGIALSCV